VSALPRSGHFLVFKKVFFGFFHIDVVGVPLPFRPFHRPLVRESNPSLASPLMRPRLPLSASFLFPAAFPFCFPHSFHHYLSVALFPFIVHSPHLLLHPALLDSMLSVTERSSLRRCTLPFPSRSLSGDAKSPSFFVFPSDCAFYLEYPLN